MTSSQTIWLTVLLAAFVSPTMLAAQGDPNETPLGDVARTVRKKTPPTLPVIDDDNFSQVMDQVESRHMDAASLHFSMPAENKSFRVAQADVTCSMSFSANAKSLLSSQYAEMKLPAKQMSKLQGPANLEGNALNISLTNGTDWHVSEVAIAFTVVRRSASGSNDSGEAKMFPPPDPAQESALRPVKKPDTTVIYRMRAADGPSATTVFSTPVDVDIDAGDEWHWAIVEAKGYPPQGYTAGVSQAASGVEPSIVVPSSLKELDSPASAALRQEPR